MEMPREEKERRLALHNLYVCFSELRRVKQAIVEGRLWEHLELRAHGHPSLLQALKRLGKYQDFIERMTPVTKPSGLLFFGSTSLLRPEVYRHGRRMERYTPPEWARVLVLLPQTGSKPFHRSKRQRRALKEIRLRLGEGLQNFHVCTYAAPFGVIPHEIDEVYPLSQHEVALPLNEETIRYVANQVAKYIESNSYEEVVLVQDVELWRGVVAEACRRACERKGIPLTILRLEGSRPSNVKG